MLFKAKAATKPDLVQFIYNHWHGNGPKLSKKDIGDLMFFYNEALMHFLTEHGEISLHGLGVLRYSRVQAVEGDQVWAVHPTTFQCHKRAFPPRLSIELQAFKRLRERTFQKHTSDCKRRRLAHAASPSRLSLEGETLRLAVLAKPNGEGPRGSS